MMPPMKISGMNTATSEMLIDITVKPICREPISAARIGSTPRLAMADDVLDHHDGIVDDEADRDGKRHQRKVVEHVAHEPHAGERAADRQRHGDRGGDGRHQPAHEHQHHQQHQRDGDQHGVLHVGHRGADRRGAVGDDGELDVGRQPLHELRQQLLDAIHRLDDVGAGLLGDGQQDGRLLAVPCREPRVGDAVDHRRDVGQSQDRAIAGL